MISGLRLHDRVLRNRRSSRIPRKWDSPWRAAVRLVFPNDPCYKARAFMANLSSIFRTSADTGGWVPRAGSPPGAGGGL